MMKAEVGGMKDDGDDRLMVLRRAKRPLDIWSLAKQESR